MNDTKRILNSSYHDKSRTTVIITGARYKCDSLDDQETENRGRTGVLIEYAIYDQKDELFGLEMGEGRIQWDNTKQIEKIDLCDLVMLEAIK